jgi:ribosomal protein L15E
MPRSKSKAVSRNVRKQWEKEDMEKAITAVREKTVETFKASKMFRVPRPALQTSAKQNILKPKERKVIRGNLLEELL